MTQANHSRLARAFAALAIGSAALLPAASNASGLNSAVGHSADASFVKAEPLHRSANLSYKVAGKRYYPSKKVESFSETGRASWYAPGFHGRKTSSGEKFDMNTMTAAHRTLPIPSYARVTNLANGKSVIVRINDRGPFHNSRVLDVSKAAAQKLGFISRGTANVRVEQIVPGKNNRVADSQTAI